MAEEQQKDQNQNQSEGGDDQDTANADELLKNLKLKDEELEALKGNENLYKVLTHSLEAKREANAEAKKRREELEAIQAKIEAEEKQKLEKKGEYEKLYQETSQKLTEKDQKIKDALVKGELSRLAGEYGLAKADYLKLLDTSTIEVDVDTLTVNGAEDIFKDFKETNPELFKNANVPKTDGGQPGLNSAGLSDQDKLKALKEKAEKSRMPVDIAAYRNAKKAIENK